mgnify:CR=1 FL=1
MVVFNLATNEYEFMLNKDVNHIMKLDMEDGSSLDVTGADVYNLIFHSGQPWNISANGTIFKTAEEFQGIIPGLLERWYAERKELQAKKKNATTEEEIAFWDKRQLVKKITTEASPIRAVSCASACAIATAWCASAS